MLWHNSVETDYLGKEMTTLVNEEFWHYGGIRCKDGQLEAFQENINRKWKPRVQDERSLKPDLRFLYVFGLPRF